MKCTQCGTEHTVTANSNGLCFDCFKEAHPVTQELCEAHDYHASQGHDLCGECGCEIIYDQPLISI